MLKEELLNKEKCHRSLNGKKISDKDYEHVIKVSDAMKTMKEYHNFYVKSDVLLMSLFNSLKRHGLRLYPTHYLSTLPLCWDAFIWQMLNVTLFQILTCLSFLYFRYSKANIEYLKSCDPK